MEREFREILNDYLLAGVRLEPNPIEDVRDRVTLTGHGTSICRAGEIHTHGGAAAASAEATYQGISEDDDNVGSVRIGGSPFWEMDSIWELTGSNAFNLRTNP